MRAAYLAQDRPDIGESVKCLTRHMAAPRESSMAELKLSIRYLSYRLVAELSCVAQEPVTHLNAFVDSDWAGDTLFRKSTTGLCVMAGHRWC